jgi:hypothetical protein
MTWCAPIDLHQSAVSSREAVAITVKPAPRQLDRHRADATGATDDQQRFALAAALAVERHALEQQLPRRERGQRQGCRGRGVDGPRRVTGQPRVDQMELRIAAGAGHVAGVIHAIAWLEATDGCADCLDRAGRVVAEHPGLRFDLRLRRADLGIDRVHRHRLDAHQQVVFAGCGLRQLDIEEGLRIIDRQVTVECDGFHACGSVAMLNGTGGGLRSANMPFQ